MWPGDQLRPQTPACWTSLIRANSTDSGEGRGRSVPSFGPVLRAAVRALRTQEAAVPPLPCVSAELGS